MIKPRQLVDNIKKYFDWTPIEVSGPFKSYYNYTDVGRVLLGYVVQVTYRHHGLRTYLFATDEEKLGLVSQAQAYTKATKFRDKIQQQIRQGKQK